MAYQIKTEKQERLVREAYQALHLLQQEPAFQDAPWLEQQLLTLHALRWNKHGVTKTGKPAKIRMIKIEQQEQPLGSKPEAHGQEPAP